MLISTAMIGTTLSHFRITAKLGEGGMGEVYLAEDTNLQRQVALKILPTALSNDKRAKDRFLQEALAASSLDHANVCTLYEVGETDDGQMFLAMAYYGGDTLRERISESALDIDEALRLASQIAKGLCRAHHSGVVHRDIKPANVVLSEHGQAKIVDFGLALLAEGARLTRPGTTVGTPAYMSPEQIHGEAIDSRTDIWSTTAMLYEMLTGSLPFAGANESAIIYSILNEDPKPPQRQGKPLPADIRQILDRGLAKNPADRYQDAADLAADLDRARRQSSERTLTLETTAVPREDSRKPWPMIALLALVVGIVAYLGLQQLGDNQAPAPSTATVEPEASVIAVLPFTVRGSPDYEYLSEGLVDLLSTKLDGAGELRSVDSHALLSYAAQEFEESVGPGEAAQVAGHFGASLYLLGEVLEAGDQLHISASLYSAEQPQPLSRASVEGPAVQIFELLDGLTSELLAEQISGPSAQVNRTAALTTESLPALKKYLQAEELLRGGHFTDSLTIFQQAVELDPEFALAWYRLSVAAEWATRRELVEEAAAQAVRLSDRLSVHYRQLLEARLAARRGEPVEAERLYRNILRSHPDDVEAWSQLSEVLSHHSYLTGISMTESRQPWLKVLELEPDYVMGLWHLARVAGKEGEREELAVINGRIRALNPEADRLVETLSLEAFGSDDVSAQQEILATLRDSSDTVVGVTAWSLSMVYDDFDALAAIAKVLTDPSRSADSQRLGWTVTAYMDLARGRWTTGRKSLESLKSVSRAAALEHGGLLMTLEFTPTSDLEREELLAELERWDPTQELPSLERSNFYAGHEEFRPQIRQYLMAVLQAQLGRASAVDSAQSLVELPGNERARAVARDLARGVRARWLLSQGNQAGALRELEALTFETLSYQDAMASPYLSLAAERYLKAQLLVELGKAERAMPILTSFSETSFFDDVFVAPSHYLRGEAFNTLDQPEKAAQHYNRFLEFWKDCEAPLCEQVEEARKQLANLKN